MVMGMVVLLCLLQHGDDNQCDKDIDWGSESIVQPSSMGEGSSSTRVDAPVAQYVEPMRMLRRYIQHPRNASRKDALRAARELHYLVSLGNESDEAKERMQNIAGDGSNGLEVLTQLLLPDVYNASTDLYTTEEDTGAIPSVAAAVLSVMATLDNLRLRLASTYSVRRQKGKTKAKRKKDRTIHLLVRLLRHKNAKARQKAAEALVNLSILPMNSDQIGNAGGATVLIDLIGNSEFPIIQAHAATLLGTLAVKGEWAMKIHAGNEAIPQLVAMVRRLHGADNRGKTAGKKSLQVAAAHAIRNLAMHAPCAEAMSRGEQVVRGEGLLMALIEMTLDSTAEGKLWALIALGNLSGLESNAKRIINLGGLHELVTMLDSGHEMYQSASLHAFQQLAVHKQARKAIMKSHAIVAVIQMLKVGVTQQRIMAAATLTQLAHDRKCRKEIRKQGAEKVLRILHTELKDSIPDGMRTAPMEHDALVEEIEAVLSAIMGGEKGEERRGQEEGKGRERRRER